MQKYINYISESTHFSQKNISNIIELLESGCTIPFIARYRKELTGGLNEVEIDKIATILKKLKELEARKEVVLKSIEQQNLLTKELQQKIEQIQTLTDLEDLYLPYKPKRRTRATIAKEKGLEPLAKQIMQERNMNLSEYSEEELLGARDIIAEWVSENVSVRQKMRNYFNRNSLIKVSKAKGYKENSKYEQWLGWQENAMKSASHRILALFRAEEEGEVNLSLLPEDNQDAVEVLSRGIIRQNNSASKQKQKACEDCYKRLLAPSLENELRAKLKEKADIKAIEVFSQNLRQLLMSSPLGEKRTLAIDPGIRTGCKIVCLDANGKLLSHDVIYPHLKERESEITLIRYVKEYDIEAIAIGNGTASKETERFVRKIDFSKHLIISVVNESGASVYSASETAREEFGDYDITVRGAVSIGRRLQDPLAELVKIEPKSIGVGQYQHDVNQNLLSESLHKTVESCVNQVGVELNTASYQLLSYISGIGPVLAKNIVEYRNQHGAYSSRNDLLKVKRFGEKAFEQSAGFLRIRHSKNPLDNTAVHPERYSIVEQMAKDLNCKVKDLIDNASKREEINLSKYIKGDCGLPTLTDIVKELAKPSRDIRTKFEEFTFNNGIDSIEQLYVGQQLEGLVTNITAFGAFVDLGVHQDGLVHVSEISNEFINDINDVLSLNQRVRVKVIAVDYERKRISLSMKF
ncbi:MAG: RNA-binding transcriptional accessory protein [Bacteroidales bacterium]|jgi:uncharacterized protein|nr:RNA-binding transcriptional accessory protein [Bacteroidales bacterium]